MRMRLSLMTALMVSGLAATQGHHFCAVAVERSAHAFTHYFEALRQEPLNPVERVVFSLVLARTKVQQECAVAARHG